ncbi:hypothetical protein GM3708_1973 [Geminocystis sp. NIES-3708]|nr:hypothetical protein [Geminocystis sp. NIES-3708]BAQ61567.1 hypothetical protein GM3708_1973 [Geminocystis sp. NIES-3708]
MVESADYLLNKHFTRGLSPLPDYIVKPLSEINVKLKADKTNHKIIIDEVTTLKKIPPLA